MADPRPENAAAIAIVGMAGRFPGAASVDALWENLAAGRESISRLSDAELLASGIRPEMLAQANYVKARGILEGVDLFDAPLFGFTPREAELTDPQHRLFLETCWTALEAAGYDAESYPGPIGVFGGLSMNTYLLTTLARNPEFLKELTESYQIGSYPTVLGNDYNFLATRVSYKLNLKGPSDHAPDRLLDLSRGGLPGVPGLLRLRVRRGAGRRRLDHLPAEAGIPLPGRRAWARRTAGAGPSTRQAQGPCSARVSRVVVLKRLADALARRGHDRRGDPRVRGEQRRLVQGRLHGAERGRAGRR